MNLDTEAAVRARMKRDGYAPDTIEAEDRGTFKQGLARFFVKGVWLDGKVYKGRSSKSWDDAVAKMVEQKPRRPGR